jgi:hypothetical protein
VITCFVANVAPTLTRGHVTDEVGRLREARLSPASRPGSLRERRVDRALLRFKCALVPRKRRRESCASPALTLLRFKGALVPASGGGIFCKTRQDHIPSLACGGGLGRGRGRGRTM